MFVSDSMVCNNADDTKIYVSDHITHKIIKELESVMFCKKRLDNKINHLHEQALPVACGDNNSAFTIL